MDTEPLTPLHAFVVRRLHGVTLRRAEAIEKETGVAAPTIVKIARGLSRDPGVSKIERLHEYLTRDGMTGRNAV